MAWGRLDDGFDDHPKVVALLDEDDPATAGLAVGLWTLCWTWAHRNTRKRGQVHGLLPAGLPRRFFGALGKDAAQLLVKHRLWEPQEDGGWLIHDFEQYLPTEGTRDARSEAGRRGAAARWAEKHAAEAEMANSHSEDGNLPSATHASASNPIASDGSRAPARRDPIPTPIPKPKEQVQELLPPKAGTRKPASRTAGEPPDRFDEFYSIFPRKKEPADARKAWDKAIKAGTDPTVITAGAQQYRTERFGQDPKFTAYPASWLNAQGWLSEPDVPSPKPESAGKDGRRVSTDFTDLARIAREREVS